MNLHEYQAKELFARFGLPVLPGQVASSPEEAREIAASIGGTVVIKVRPDRLDDAGRLGAETGGQRQLVEATAMVGIDVVDADRRVADARLTGAGVADGDFLPAQDFGTTVGVDTDGVRHESLL